MQYALALSDAKFDMNKMRELAANWVLMHEHPFKVVENEGFNMMQRCGMPLWEKITRTALKQDCVIVYEIQKKKLKLHKRVLNFIHIPAPRPGVEIAAAIYKCLIEWGIENKVFSISVDNASSNDTAIKILKENLGRNKKLMCGGRLFHVRCAAHILNLMVQDELSQIKPIIQDICDCILYVKQPEIRVIMFLEIVQMLPKQKPILDCKTRWNSTYEMLVLAIQYRDVFPMLVQLDNNFTCAPIDKDWEKLEKVCEILEAFNSVTNVISGSEYPTSNLFLQEIVDIKELLDEKCSDDDDFIWLMMGKMKEKFDKYWGECNFVMAIATVLDPRMKMRLLQFAYP
ncbi:zinc finger BED domain-containing protein RICESLEEPER 2-like [Pistacia vera]|uniref:zinc finger BED domain-containing protein RICESLEEPER 2-like n=1 Tax=Pistacia vera TaxID=55513 RepID=UPI0012638F70|nr:zinc finger BED domain-containing protein RICESLEEPER 2-like [Pistacia vera]